MQTPETKARVGHGWMIELQASQTIRLVFLVAASAWLPISQLRDQIHDPGF